MNKQNNVKKQDWGFEILWTNSQNYCGKLLVFQEANKKTGFFFHKQKDKTWFVNSGKFLYKWIDTSDGKIYQSEIKEGDTYHVPQHKPCFLQSLVANSSITEVSNGEFDDDFCLVIRPEIVE